MSSLLPHSLSSGCKSALQQLSADADAKACFDPAPLVSMITDPNFVNISIVDPISTWLTSLCGLGSCSNATLSAIVTNVTTGCSSELSSFGYDSNTAASVIALLQQGYPVARKLVCLQE